MLDRCNDDSDRLAALDAFPDLYEAYMLYDASDTATENKWELEARILARELVAGISRKLGVSEKVMDIYGRIFFDVKDRLDAPSLITHTVIGRGVQTGLAEREYDCLWKLFGYWCGPAVLDMFVYKFNSPQHASTPDSARSSLRDFTKDTVELKGAVTMLTTPVNWQSRELIMNLWKDLMTIEVQAGASGTGGESFMQSVEDMTNSFCGLFVKYRPGVDEAIDTTITDLEKSGPRLRSSELAAIGMGNTPTGLEHLMGGAKFPERGEQ